MIREVHAELVVDRSLVLGIRVCQHRDDVFELAYQCLDLDRGELAAGRLSAELSFEVLALTFHFGDPVGDDGEVAVLLEEGQVPTQLRYDPLVIRLERRTVMPTVAFAAPILPGKADADRAAMASCSSGERKDAYEESRRRAGITKEAVWIQSTPMGDMAVVLIEAADLDKAFATLATSDEPFDRWFRDQIRDVHGISLEDGMPLPEQVLHFDANGH